MQNSNIKLCYVKLEKSTKGKNVRKKKTSVNVKRVTAGKNKQEKKPKLLLLEGENKQLGRYGERLLRGLQRQLE